MGQREGERKELRRVKGGRKGGTQWDKGREFLPLSNSALITLQPASTYHSYCSKEQTERGSHVHNTCGPRAAQRKGCEVKASQMQRSHVGYLKEDTIRKWLEALHTAVRDRSR